MQHSSGEKGRMGRIAKQQGSTLRSCLFVGARSVVCKLKHREPTTEKERWLKGLIARRGSKCAALALA
ncbi:transposase, partial [Motilimonas sp. 1_MG-2023]|uniref:transposase n=1 Tax=Motilimonas sp. 1_MG-2023 TaxID=3062672 RepID=UPI0026E17DFF